MSQPNIIFFMADRMRADCIGLLGHQPIDTPYLDQLGRSGVVFTSAYSSCPSCIASRASMFTGLSPSSHGRLGYRDRVPWRYDDMLPHLLGAAGYQTHCVGKTHFYPQRAHLGFHSLDSYEALQNFDGLYINDYHEWLREKTAGRLEETAHGLPVNGWVARASHLPEELHNNTWTATKSIEFLRRRDKSRPFFLNVSFHRPHSPIDPPRDMLDQYRDRVLPPVPVGDWAHIHDVAMDDVNTWHGRLPEHQIAASRRAYFAQISHIDLQIGRILNTLKHEIKPGPTYILFTSDHGEMLGDHRMFKLTYAYEGSAKIPMILCGPEHAHATVCPAPVVCEDIYPTLLSIAGVPIPESNEGSDLLPYLRQAQAQAEGRAESDGNGIPSREYVHGEHADSYSPEEAMQFVTDGKQKYIWFTKTGREQLFDLEADPQECRNLMEDSASADRLDYWRAIMVRELAQRPADGLSDGKKLIPGKLLPAVRDSLL